MLLSPPPLLSTQKPVADLHCDLLLYLSGSPSRSPHDLAVRCPISKLREGNVKIQVMAISSETTPEAKKKGLLQAEIYKKLPLNYPEDFLHIRRQEHLEHILTSKAIGILPAVENASSICDETEDLELVLKHLTTLQHKIGKFAYLSFTWNSENRFGGGASTCIGLKKDGKRLLEYLCERTIPIDFSHASDHLAHDIFNYLEKHNLNVPVLASHSNMRVVTQMPRNLPDDIAKEIIKREGVIGLNFIRHFVGGETPDYFAKHFEHLIQLKGEKAFCFGADFYCDEDLPVAYRRPLGSFFPNLGNSGVYPYLIELLHKQLFLSEALVDQLSHLNFINFLKKHVIRSE